ncbi:DUF4296 domain-containing protein [Flavobacterium sp.]|uniref:DUF4296 domain-containing protein n=1 Tax=Flavobacterium sp. TaxID=239 RepID=UPI00260A024F|nr:DUF4296 domain-containing protein [Flavobacterium sp.]
MKTVVLFLSLLILGACSNKNDIPKPEKPIDKETMENILYDLALLQALKSYSPAKLIENKVNSATYIYQKYKIDSLQLVQNNNYFASNTEEYNLMFDRINKRLLEQKIAADTLVKKDLKIKAKKRRDSIASVNKEMSAKFKKQVKDIK